MMFNTDFEMFYDLELDPATSATRCNLNPQCESIDTCAETDCPVSPMYDLSMDYAKVSLLMRLEGNDSKNIEKSIALKQI